MPCASADSWPQQSTDDAPLFFPSSAPFPTIKCSTETLPTAAETLPKAAKPCAAQLLQPFSFLPSILGEPPMQPLFSHPIYLLFGAPTPPSLSFISHISKRSLLGLLHLWVLISSFVSCLEVRRYSKQAKLYMTDHSCKTTKHPHYF